MIDPASGSEAAGPGAAATARTGSAAGAGARLSPGNAVQPAPDRTGRGSLAWALATLCGVGHFPIASGTAGSLAALAVWWAAQRLTGAWGTTALLLLFAAAGVWAAGRAAAASGVSDPSEVVVDEAAGMFMSLAFLPTSWGFVLAAFFIFRVLDVIKPWPANVSERLPGGWGVMADDLIAALYTNLLLQVAAFWVLR
jgi:phosphatidylglycerophosphatase A